MLRRILAAVIIVIGLALIGLGVASATVWRPADHMTVSASPDSAPATLVMPGVLAMVDENVTVTAAAENADDAIVLVFARANDMLAWVGDTDRLQIEGLADWETLETNRIEGEEDTIPNPRGSDLWSEVIEGEGEVTFDLTADNRQIIMLAATDGSQPAPTLTFTWPIEVSTPYMVPLIAAGSVLALIGIVWIAYGLLVARELRQREAAQEEIEQKSERQILETQVFRSDQPMTRRQLREMQRKFKEQDPRHATGGPVAATAGGVGAGVLPGVADPGFYRAQRYVPVDDSAELPVITADTPDPTRETPHDLEWIASADEASDSPASHDSPSRTSWRSLWDIKEDEK